MSSDLAPIVLFAYRRVDHLRRAVESLRSNPDASRSRLYVFSDAPRGDRDARDVEKVRRFLPSIDGFADVTVVARSQNYGLAKSITSGVTKVLSEHDRVIVVEDDLVVSPHFLSYMNEGLRVYRNEPRVASIHGYVYPLHASVPETFFVRGADCWGWGTWRDRWTWFDPDGQSLRQRLRSFGLEHAFNFDGAYDYIGMLEDQIAGRNDSWAIRWHASCFLRGALTLYPGRSLVVNSGMDGMMATHSAKSERFDVGLSPSPVIVSAAPAVEDVAARAVIREYFLRSAAK